MYILLSNHANLNKTLGQFENLLFVIMSTRENIYILSLELLIQFNQLQIYCFHYVFTVYGYCMASSLDPKKYPLWQVMSNLVVILKAPGDTPIINHFSEKSPELLKFWILNTPKIGLTFLPCHSP